MELQPASIILIAVVIIFIALMIYIPVGLWFAALLSGVKITILELLFMKWRRVPPELIVKSMIMLTKGGVACTREELEIHFLAGGDVQKVTNTLLQAKAYGKPLSFKEAAQLDLAKKTSF